MASGVTLWVPGVIAEYVSAYDLEKPERPDMRTERHGFRFERQNDAWIRWRVLSLSPHARSKGSE